METVREMIEKTNVENYVTMMGKYFCSNESVSSSSLATDSLGEAEGAGTLSVSPPIVVSPN